MPVVLGLASSHAPSMFVEASEWPTIHGRLTKGVPQPPQLALETPEVLEQYVERIKAGFAHLSSAIDRAELDVLIIIGDDQTEVFSNACVPAFGIYTGDGVSGSISIPSLGQSVKDNWYRFATSPTVAETLLNGLMDKGFDPAYLETIVPLGNPDGSLGHAFTRVAKVTGLHESGLPIIPLFVNGYHPPLPSAARCYALGRAITEIFRSRPERVGLYASGGMSHCPGGPRAGWVDEPLDRWVMAKLEQGETEALTGLFSFDSDTLRSGTGELRAWVSLAGAFAGVPAKIVDYIPARHAVTGLGFATWGEQ
ncbi:hypothetical protein [Sphingopyxis sp.]|uniref:DODA-type extradiol aromatic ring-opening family dioxygenase n=1 Tax=Sphingopyxis sp. TaxID=1908224 RepID=UPI002D775C39|nr:hypothetical protein [Sphingopyxis sp.]HET6523087.1 hypothetical protein [Sphingopyxis sp.]